MSDPTPRERLEAIYRAAVDAIQPLAAVQAAFENEPLRADVPLHLLAVGKAARTMLAAALAWCDERRIAVAGGVCVSHETGEGSAREGFFAARGDHPDPGDASAHAAEVLRAYVTTRLEPGAQVVVLLSGGTSALLGAPAGTLRGDDYRACCRILLRSGLDITAHNALRRQLSAWGNGRLGAASQAAGAQAVVFAISDVPGEDVGAIGSAPCIAGGMNAADDDAMLAAATMSTSDRAMLQAALACVAGHAVQMVESIPHRIISSNRHAREAVASAAAVDNIPVTVMPEPLRGDAHHAAEEIVRTLLAAAPSSVPALYCWGGEPVMSLPPGAPPGGRMQALALAAARALHAAGSSADGITLLAAGTDGRDGATDAAGAVIDHDTWSAVQRSGGDPSALLDAYDSHAALRHAGCLIPAFASGTNVNDLVIARIDPAARRRLSP